MLFVALHINKLERTFTLLLNNPSSPAPGTMQFSKIKPAFTWLVLSLTLAVVITLFASCSNHHLPGAQTSENNQATTVTAAPTNTGKYLVSVGENIFEPESITIERGDAVTWLNKDGINHSIVSLYHFQDEDDVSHIFLGETWVSGDIAPGASFTKVFNESGVFKYVALPLTVRTPMEQYYTFSLFGIGVVTVK